MRVCRIWCELRGGGTRFPGAAVDVARCFGGREVRQALGDSMRSIRGFVVGRGGGGGEPRQAVCGAALPYCVATCERASSRARCAGRAHACAVV